MKKRKGIAPLVVAIIAVAIIIVVYFFVPIIPEVNCVGENQRFMVVAPIYRLIVPSRTMCCIGLRQHVSEGFDGGGICVK